MQKHDVVIIGSGIAGMTAAIYLKRSNIDTLIIENGVPGGQLNNSNSIKNYPGYLNIEGPTLAYNIYNQVTSLEVPYLHEDIKKIDFDNNTIYTKNKIVTYKYLIIATGRSPKKLDILEKYEKKGVSYCAVCDGALYKNKDVLVLGGGNTAFEEALYLSNICKSVTILHRNNNIKADEYERKQVMNKKNISLILNEEIKTITYNNIFKVNDKYLVNAIFVCIGKVPNTSLFNLKKDNDYLLVNDEYKTNISNVYAIGDVIKKKVYQLTTASSEATIVALDIIKKINNVKN